MAKQHAPKMYQNVRVYNKHDFHYFGDYIIAIDGKFYDKVDFTLYPDGTLRKTYSHNYKSIKGRISDELYRHVKAAIDEYEQKQSIKYQ